MNIIPLYKKLCKIDYVYPQNKYSIYNIIKYIIYKMSSRLDNLIIVSDFDSIHSDQETDNTYDSDDENYDHIYDLDQEFAESEKQNGQYCIGICKKMNNEFVYLNALSNSIFFSLPCDYALNYLYYYSIIHLDFSSIKINIMKLNIASDGTYNVILKTFWLRMIQRNWKRVFKERQEIIQKRKHPMSQLCFSLRGRYPEGLNHLPSIYGLMKGHQV